MKIHAHFCDHLSVTCCLSVLLALTLQEYVWAADELYEDVESKRGGGRAFQLAPGGKRTDYLGDYYRNFEEKRGGARMFRIGSSAGIDEEKRGGGRAFAIEADKRGGARPFGMPAADLKRAGGRFFSYYGRNSAAGDWIKRGGGRAFQQKRGGARAFLGGTGGGMFESDSGLQIVPTYPRSDLKMVAVPDEISPARGKFFYQNNHNFEGLKRGGSRVFLSQNSWPYAGYTDEDIADL